MIISALRGNVACFRHGLSFLHKRILLSYCLCVFTLSAKGTTFMSLSTTQSVFMSSRMSSFCAYCSKSGFTHSDGVDATLESGADSSSMLAKKCLTLPKQDQLLEVPKIASEVSSRLPKGYDNARVLLVGDGDLSFAAALSTLKVCHRFVNLRRLFCEFLN